MEFEQFLRERQAAIAKQWAEALLRAYPEEGAKFFSAQSNQFSNPVGHTFREGVHALLALLIQGAELDSYRNPLDEIIRIRAVQGLTPATALCFLPALREIVHREAEPFCCGESFSRGLHDWNIRLDQLTLLGFDLYMLCREELWKQKANQLYNRTHKLLEKSNLLQDGDKTE